MKKLLISILAIGSTILSFSQEDNATVQGSEVDQSTLDSLGLTNPKIAEKYNEGVKFLNSGKNIEAIQSFTEVILMDAQHSQAYYNRGVAQMI